MRLWRISSRSIYFRTTFLICWFCSKNSCRLNLKETGLAENPNYFQFSFFPFGCRVNWTRSGAVSDNFEFWQKSDRVFRRNCARNNVKSDILSNPSQRKPRKLTRPQNLTQSFTFGSSINFSRSTSLFVKFFTQTNHIRFFETLLTFFIFKSRLKNKSV